MACVALIVAFFVIFTRIVLTIGVAHGAIGVTVKTKLEKPAVISAADGV